MPNVAIAAEPMIRLSCFLGVLMMMMLWEVLAPRRPQAIGRLLRWPNNLGLVVLDTVLVRLLFPLAAVGMAFLAQNKGWGLFNLAHFPGWVAILAAVLLLDLIIYGQHVTFHAVPWLWRLHRMHHADLEFDVTTGLRFHPGEILLSMLIKLAAVLVLGAPPVAVLVFEVVLNATSMFNHGNVRLPSGLDRVLRRVLVTPEMHRVHHSIEQRETDSNFGFNLPWWDRLFGTYRVQPALGHTGMMIGIDRFREPRELWLHRMLVQPFLGGSRNGTAPARRAMMTVLRLGLLLLLTTAAVWLAMHRQMIDLGTLEPTAHALGIWAPLGFVVIYALGTVLFFSGALLSLAGGALFGPVWGTLWNLLGATLGATAAFLLARGIAGPWVARRLGGRLRRLMDGVSVEGWRFVALMRLVPLVPFNLLNYALGLTGIALPAYVLASLVCMLPGAIAFTWLGYAGRSAAAGDMGSLRYGLLGLGVLAMIAFLPRLFRRFSAKEPAWIDTAELQQRLSSAAPVVIVDVRQPEEFMAPPGHLPGAVNVPLAELAKHTSGLAARKQPIVVICKTDRRSARAATELRAAGLHDVAVLRGGTDAWLQQGRALE
ncbi:MAG TPA: sterol desaturase family protein [Rhodopila sp.]|nr:sterol desaturase family protein [Rhodopila sp.]